MRSLIDEQGGETAKKRINNFRQTHFRLQKKYHAQCMFNPKPPLSELSFHFSADGALYGNFECDGGQQGFAGIVHGGVLAAVIDASMAQCLMGHGIAGYTTNLSIRYHKPVAICRAACLRTWIENVHCGMVYSMRCEIRQNSQRAVLANGKFYQFQKKR